MKTIAEPKENITKILGAQSLHAEATYRLMRYVLQVEHEGCTYLNNTITGQLVRLSPDEAAALRVLPATIGELAPTDVSELVAAYYFVPIAYEEKSTVDKLRMLMRRILTPKGINSYTILTTTNCNAHCFYCFQANYEHVNLSEQTANDLVEYMVAHKGEGPLKLRWFGGEPLLGVARIDQIHRALSELGVEHESSSMISNGLLFTREIVERASSEWGLKRVQITLDGTQDMYNRVKRYGASVANPFQRVIDNIDMLISSGIRVSIRLNYDLHNMDDIGCLIDYLGNRFKNRENISVYVMPLFEGKGFAPIQRSAQDTQELSRMRQVFTRRIHSVGLARNTTKLSALRVYGCMADSPNTVVVFPDGRLYKCEEAPLGDMFGSIYLGVTNQENIDKYKRLEQFERCGHCVLYPACICLSGCPGSKRRNAQQCQAQCDKALWDLQVAVTKQGS